MAMLKRIKEIKNIGVFSNFTNGASIGLEKINFIYGLNTYGKTTLTDILQSLKNNDSSIITSRKTIPTMSTEQKVTLSVKEDTSITEKDLLFKDGNWNKNSISAYIDIFGTDFIHKNVFTGLIIERGNKENFTQFILGEQGVSLAKQIREKRQVLGNSKKDLKNKVPIFVNGKNEIEINKFLVLPTDGLVKINLEDQLLEKKNSLKNEKERLKEPSKILNIKEPTKLEIPKNNILETIDLLNTLLIEDYSNIKEASIDKLNQHLSNNFSEKDGAEIWIKTGLHYCKDQTNGDCPFCGQSLKDVRNLIELYNSYFDEEYNTYIRRITNELNSISSIEIINFNMKSAIQTSFNIINQYKGLITNPNFDSTLLALDEVLNSLQEDELNLKKNELLSSIKNYAAEKIKAPYKKIDPINIEYFKENVREYYDALNNSNQLIEALIEEINSFKKQYKDSSAIQKSIDELNKSITDLEYKNARIELDSACTTYKALQKDITDAEKEIDVLDTKLQEDQSQYLKEFFIKINHIFKKLGSKNFTLEKETENRGHLPVYSLKIKFHGVDIPNDKLDSVFSESDRRALALSIFWVKISLKTDEEKLKTIVVLDDPVTSFDDNRITNSINIFKDSLESISQLIVLTHYPHFIKRFCEITKPHQISFKFIELKLNENTSFLTSADIEQFNSSDYEKMFLKIYGFINRTHIESIKTDLRPFLETLYLPMIFAKKIKDNNVDCSSLDKMIDGIFEDDALMKSKFHRYRTDLNPDAHIVTTNNEEDVRNFAIELIDCLYSLKYEAVQ